MNNRKINEQELNKIVNESIKKTINEKQQVNEQVNEIAPLIPLAGMALRAGGKYLAKKGLNKLAQKGMQKFGGNMLKNMGQNVLGNMMNGNQQQGGQQQGGQQQGNGGNFQQLMQAFQNFMQIYRMFKGSGQQTNPMFDKLVGNLGNMLLKEQELRKNKKLL